MWLKFMELKMVLFYATDVDICHFNISNE